MCRFLDCGRKLEETQTGTGRTCNPYTKLWNPTHNLLVIRYLLITGPPEEHLNSFSAWMNLNEEDDQTYSSFKNYMQVETVSHCQLFKCFYGWMKPYFAASICKDFHQVSLWSPLLTLALVVGTLRQSAPGRSARSRWLLRRCWRQQLALRLSCICRSVEFLPSSPSPHGTGRGTWHLCPPCTPRRTCPEQTAARAAKGGLVPDPLSCSTSLTKDGVGSQRGHVWIRAQWAQNRLLLRFSLQ